MPELPDLRAYVSAIEERALGRRLERVVIAHPFLLRTVAPTPRALEARALEEIRLIGKRIALGFGDTWAVIHLMIAGRFAWGADASALRKRIGLAAFAFEDGALLLREAAKKKRASLSIVSDDALASLDPGGLPPLALNADAFRAQVSARVHTLKRALTDPRILAGIGNAYSDEILFAAKLSPFRRTDQLDDVAWQRLHAATHDVLSGWIDRLEAERDGAFPTKVTAFRAEMSVHGRFGQPCTVCGAAIQRIRYASNEANYCARCQTGGRLLQDRSLSRLLKKDWPKTLDELEAIARGG